MFTDAALPQEYILHIGLGSYLIILGFVLLFRADYYRALIAKTKEPGTGSMLSAILHLLVGVFFVVMHNFWAFEPRVFVTLVCWAYLLNAILWLVVPVAMMNALKRVASGPGYYLMLLVMFIVGTQILTRVAYFYLHHEGGASLMLSFL